MDYKLHEEPTELDVEIEEEEEFDLKISDHGDSLDLTTDEVKPIPMEFTDESEDVPMEFTDVQVVTVEVEVEGDGITPEELEEAIKDYFAKNPIKVIAKYPDLEEKPKINGVELKGDKTAKDLKLQPEGSYLTEVPSGYVKEDALKEYAKRTEIPTVPKKVSAFENDADYAKKTELPNVPAWAMQPSKPAYTAEETGADPKGSASKALEDAKAHAVQTSSKTLEDAKSYASEATVKALSDANAFTEQKVTEHNTGTETHNDIRLFLKELNEKVNHFLDIDDTTKDQASEIVKLIEDNREIIEQITTDKVNVTDIIDDLATNVGNKPLSAAQGVVLKALFDSIPAWAKEANKPSYNASEVGADPAGTAVEKVGEHNQSETAHADIRKLIADIKIPEVPEWAMQTSKPSYSASEVGAEPAGTATEAVNQHNSSKDAHADIRQALAGIKVPTKVSELVNDENYLKEHQDLSTYARVIVADTHTRNFTNSSFDSYCAHGHVEHWSSINNRNDYKLGDICLIKAQNTSNSNQKEYIFVLALYPTSTGVQGLSLGHAPVDWS